MSVRPSIRCAAPATCSGAMYAGVPETTPSSEPPAPASSRPSPKSTRTGPRSGVRMMFAGLTSRWTMSRAWAWARASATAAAIRAASGQAGRLSLSHSAEVGAVEEIRDDVDLPLVQADVVDRHDAGVAQPGEPAGLLEESLGLGVRHVGAAAEDLDGHGPVELRVVAEVHRAEAAGSQGAPHLVAAEGGGSGRPSSSPAAAGGPGVRSVVRSDSLPGSGGLTAGLGSAESDCTATSPEGSSG